MLLIKSYVLIKTLKKGILYNLFCNVNALLVNEWDNCVLYLSKLRVFLNFKWV